MRCCDCCGGGGGGGGEDGHNVHTLPVVRAQLCANPSPSPSPGPGSAPGPSPNPRPTPASVPTRTGTPTLTPSLAPRIRCGRSFRFTLPDAAAAAAFQRLSVSGATARKEGYSVDSEHKRSSRARAPQAYGHDAAGDIPSQRQHARPGTPPAYSTSYTHAPPAEVAASPRRLSARGPSTYHPAIASPRRLAGFPSASSTRADNERAVSERMSPRCAPSHPSAAAPGLAASPRQSPRQGGKQRSILRSFSFGTREKTEKEVGL